MRLAFCLLLAWAKGGWRVSGSSRNTGHPGWLAGWSQCRSRRPGSVGMFIGLVGIVVVSLSFTASAWAQSEPEDLLPERDGQLVWDSSGRQLLASVAFRDAITPEIQAKLRRGLPTTVVMTALVHVVGQEEPVATTVQSCKTTWHVWEEMYRVELTRPNDGGKLHRHWTPTLNGVLRRCAEANRLLVAVRAAVPPGARLYLRATVQVNPLSKELLQKIQHWITLPARSAATNTGGALFGTFTRLFMTRVGEAEHIVEFRTRSAVPTTESVPIN